MALTTLPEVGTRVRGEWVHPEDESQWETIVGTVVPHKEAYMSEDGAAASEEEFDFLNDVIDVFHGTVAVKIETKEHGVIPEDIKDDLSDTYAIFAFENVVVLD